MGSEWKETTLGRIALGADGAVDGPFGSNLPASCYTPTGIPIIRGSNLTLGPSRFKSEDFVYTSEDMFQKLRRSECLPGDIIFTKKGTLGQTGIVPCDKKYDKYLLSSNQMRLRIDSELADSEFVYYYVSSEASLEKIKRESEATGVPKINLEYLRNFPIRLPTLNVQKKTVNILKSLDNKITLNRKLNQTLEHMAQALFKSWFVDFDPVIDNALAAGNVIPDDLQDRALLRQGIRQLQLAKADHKPLPENIRKLFPSEFELTESFGWVPKGWGVSSAEHEFSIKGGGTPSTANADFWEGGDICWSSPKDLSGNTSKILLDTEKKITQLGLEKISSGLLPVNTVLMSSRAPVGYLALAKVPVAINQGYIALICNGTLTPEYTIQWLASIMDTIQGMAGGTTFAEISKRTFKSISLLVPSKEVVLAFGNLAEENYEAIAKNVTNSKILERTRDSLLPKLISGEIRIGEPENV